MDINQSVKGVILGQSVSYFDVVLLTKQAKMILADSGGLQGRATGGGP
jgi:UDP-N-acetylglucosamine 2-epimerase